MNPRDAENSYHSPQNSGRTGTHRSVKFRTRSVRDELFPRVLSGNSAKTSNAHQRGSCPPGTPHPREAVVPSCFPEDRPVGSLVSRDVAEVLERALGADPHA